MGRRIQNENNVSTDFALNKLILETKCDFSELTEDLLRTFVVLGIFQVMINSMLQQHVAVDECCAPDSGD